MEMNTREFFDDEILDLVKGRFDKFVGLLRKNRDEIQSLQKSLTEANEKLQKALNGFNNIKIMNNLNLPVKETKLNIDVMVNKLLESLTPTEDK